MATVVSIPEGVEPLPEGRLHDPALAASPYVLFVGVHKPHKNLTGLLDAMALAFPKEDVRLVLAGPPSPFTAQLRRRAAHVASRSADLAARKHDQEQRGQRHDRQRYQRSPPVEQARDRGARQAHGEVQTPTSWFPGRDTQAA